MNIQFSQTIIEKIVIHKIGNKNENQGIELSHSEVEIHDEHTKNILLSFFLTPFKAPDLYQFNLETISDEDSVLQSVTRMFDFEQEFYVQSANIAQKLYAVSNHPNIKQGELYVVYFRNCEVDDNLVDAIGIFKSENKDTYIKVFQDGENFGVEHERGINVKKLDKGSIIFNVDSETGYVLKVLDNTNKQNEALYWIDDFLAAKKIENDYFNTATFLQICKNFSENILTEKNNVQKNEQLGFMNKSYEYFKENDYFDEVDFKKTVIANPEIIESFDMFKQNYEESYEIEPKTEFDISQEAVKKSKKFVRSVIKLDKNFHIYVHSKPEYIEKGFDSNRKLNFYKVFFEKES